MTEFSWGDFVRATRGGAHWPLLERAAGLVGQPGSALDLGCGAGRDTRYLLSQGWHVTAVDREPEAIAALDGLPKSHLRVVQSSFEDFHYEPEAYDLISAQYTLPFVRRAAFAGVFAAIREALKPGAIFTGQFFGVHDEWNTPDSDLTFLTRQEVEELLAGMEIITLNEEERIGNTALGPTKHWHVFDVIARKPRD